MRNPWSLPSCVIDRAPQAKARNSFSSSASVIGGLPLASAPETHSRSPVATILKPALVQSSGHGGQLGDDILAVATLFDHRDHPRELSLGPAQPIQDRGNGVFVTNHGVAPYLCWGPPVKVDPLVVSVVWPRSGHCVAAVDRSRGRGGAPAAQRGRTTSRPTRIRRILGRPGKGKMLWFKSSAASGDRRESRCACRRPA